MVEYDYLELDGDRLDDTERLMIRDRECIMQTGFGLPWSEWCGRELTIEFEWCGRELTIEQVAHGQIVCDEHEADQAESWGTVTRLCIEDARRVFHGLP
jgi:hypothetical protein